MILIRITLALLATSAMSSITHAAHHGAVKAAVASELRPAADRESDSTRKPEEVLTFFGIKPGMTVLDLFAGGGYYTEILSRVVGPRGQVVSHNNAAYLNFVGEDKLKERFGGRRLPNVKQIQMEGDALDLNQGVFDAVIMMLTYHDIYYNPQDGSWPLIDGAAMLANVRGSLKTGGLVGIVDHAAQAGAPAEVGHTLHRIDPALLRREMEAAGFEFVGASDVLRNPEDDHTKPMFDPEVRGRTDRVVFLFRVK